MTFDELDQKMRVYEKSLDQIIGDEIYLIARLDGRSFTRLTKEVCDFEAPFDITFRDMMIKTVHELMNCGFNVLYGFTESDEISLLFHPKETAFGRKVRKYNSVLAGVASAAFSLQLGQVAAFDCRMIPLPKPELVKDYFLWRREDAHRNALNSHCYWAMRKKGASVEEAKKRLEGKSVDYKKELLLQHGIDFNKVPPWQKYGTGVFWDEVEKDGYNPITQERVIALRRVLHTEYELPQNAEYTAFIEQRLRI